LGNAKIYDIIRLDHFRAFDTYWKIPSSCPTAVDGAWIEAPGYAFFDSLLAKKPELKAKIIAEDLGDLRPRSSPSATIMISRG
jgi:4-alpha-glucanotransferase